MHTVNPETGLTGRLPWKERENGNENNNSEGIRTGNYCNFNQSVLKGFANETKRGLQHNTKLKLSTNSVQS